MWSNTEGHPKSGPFCQSRPPNFDLEYRCIFADPVPEHEPEHLHAYFPTVFPSSQKQREWDQTIPAHAPLPPYQEVCPTGPEWAVPAQLCPHLPWRFSSLQAQRQWPLPQFFRCQRLLSFFKRHLPNQVLSG